MSTKRIATANIDIAAPIHTVWAAMLNFDAYPEWNPFIYKVSHHPETLTLGATFLLHVRWANGSSYNSWEVLTHLDPPTVGADGICRALLTYRYASWQVRLGLVRAERRQVLSQPAAGLTSYFTQESFHGMLTHLLPLQAVEDGFKRHAAALKVRAEGLAKQKS